MVGHEKQRQKIIVIGGGTGVFAVLNGLKHHFSNITAVITMSDEGGSTGILREEFGILPPGDVRRALIALSPGDQPLLAELFSYRFHEGSGLAGHAFGNLMITALERITGSFERAVEEAGKVLGIYGKVLPVALKPTYLLTLLEDGRVVKGESSLHAMRPEERAVVKRVCLQPSVSLNPKADKAIRNADCVIIGPGDLYTSTLPNLLVHGMKEALEKTKGTVVYFVNVTTRYTETAGFRASDFLQTIERYLGKGVIDYVVVNKTKPSVMRLKPYFEQQAELVEPDIENFREKPTPIVVDLIRSSGFVRHDPEKIAKVVKMLV